MPITITPVGGGAPIVYNASQLPTTIADANGTLYQVAANGTVSVIGQNGGKDILKKVNKTLIDGDKGLVVFKESAATPFAFDQWQPIYLKSSSFSKEYEKIKCTNGGLSIHNGSYYVSAKAIAPSVTDSLYAVLRKPAGSTVNIDSVKFINGTGTIYIGTKLNDSTYAIPMLGSPANDAQEIYAVYPQGVNKPFNFGKVLVASYGRKEYKVKLVPVNGAVLTVAEVEEIKNTLVKTYGGLNLIFNVTQDSNFVNNVWDLSVPKDNKLSVNGSGLFTVLTDEMKALNKQYRINRTCKSNEFYLFIMDQAATISDGVTVLGDMPRGKQFGYIFKNQANINDISNTIAHEIGHGVFTLKHVFEIGEIAKNSIVPNNVMDYPVGRKTVKQQWDIAHDPAIVIGIFEDDNDGRNELVSNIDFDLFKNSDNLTVSFLSPAETVVSIPHNNINQINFDYGTVSGDDVYYYDYTTGTVNGFTLNDLVDNAYLNKYLWNNAAKAYKIVGKKKKGDTDFQTISNGANYIDHVDYSKVDGFILPLITGNYYSLKKFTKNNLSKYSVGANATKKFDELTLKLFSANAYIPGKEQLLNHKTDFKASECRWCITPETVQMTAGYGTSAAILLIDKIAQMRNVYPEYFDKFTDSTQWLRPYGKINQNLTRNFQNNLPVNELCGATTGMKPWMYYICSTERIPTDLQMPTLAINFSTFADTALIRTFLNKFMLYVEAQNLYAKNFWDNVNENTPRDEFRIQVNTIAKFNLENVAISKKVIAIKKLLDVPDFMSITQNINFLTNLEEIAVIKLLASAKNKNDAIIFLKTLEDFKFTLSPNPSSQEITFVNRERGMEYIWDAFDDKTFGFGNDNLTGVIYTISYLITLGDYAIENAQKITELMNEEIPSMPEAEQDLLKFKNYDSKFDGLNTLEIDKCGSNLRYNQTVNILVVGTFKIGALVFQKGEILRVPALQARLFGYKNTCKVAENTAWLALDIGLCFIGIGEVKILFTAGNYVRKTIIVANLLGSSIGIATKLLNNDLISESWKSKIQIAGLILSAPRLLQCIPKVDKLVTDLDVLINTKLASNLVKEKEAAELLREVRNKILLSRQSAVSLWEPFLNDAFVASKRAEVIASNLPNQFPNLTVEELTAIKVYTSNQTRNNTKIYAALNNELRVGELSTYNKGLANLLDNGLSKLTPYNGNKVYRGCGLEESNVAKTWVKDQEVVFKDFKSTSTSVTEAGDFVKGGNGDVLYEINNPIGYNICPISCLPNEMEILLKTNGRFLVKEIIPNIAIYDKNFNLVTSSGKKIILDFVGY